MRYLDEMIEHLASKYDAEELVELLDIPVEVLLERCDDFVEAKLDKLNEEEFDE